MAINDAWESNKSRGWMPRGPCGGVYPALSCRRKLLPDKWLGFPGGYYFREALYTHGISNYNTGLGFLPGGWGRLSPPRPCLRKCFRKDRYETP